MKTNSAFSLIEVNLAILIVAGGLLSIFSLFPVSLRQSAMSEEDLRQFTFAASLFEAMSANLKSIDEGELWAANGKFEWDNPVKFWQFAAKGTGLVDNTTDFPLKNAEDMKKETGKFSDSTRTLFDVDDEPDSSLPSARQHRLLFTGRELPTIDNTSVPTDGKLKLPPQFIVRIRKVDNNFSTYRTWNAYAASSKGVPRGPSSYVVSVVSSGMASPAIYYNNQIYSQEFYYYRRP